MKSVRLYPAILSLAILLAAGCGANPTSPSSTATSAVCVPATKSEFSYVLTGFAVSMYTVNSCTGQFTASSPAAVATGYAYPQQQSEQMVIDPLERFAYVANPRLQRVRFVHDLDVHHQLHHGSPHPDHTRHCPHRMVSPGNCNRPARTIRLYRQQRRQPRSPCSPSTRPRAS